MLYDWLLSCICSGVKATRCSHVLGHCPTLLLHRHACIGHLALKSCTILLIARKPVNEKVLLAAVLHGRLKEADSHLKGVHSVGVLDAMLYILAFFRTLVLVFNWQNICMYLYVNIMTYTDIKEV